MASQPRQHEEPDEPDRPRTDEEILADAERQLREAELFTSPPHPGPVPEILSNPPPTQPSPNSIPGDAKPKYHDDMRDRLGRLSAIGTEFVIAVAAAGFLGWLGDRWLKTGPWLLLAGLGVGLVYGFMKFVRQATEANRDASRAMRRPPP